MSQVKFSSRAWGGAKSVGVDQAHLSVWLPWLARGCATPTRVRCRACGAGR